MSDEAAPTDLGSCLVRLREAEQALHAMRAGQVDAIIARGPAGERVYVLRSTDVAYRLVLETIHEGAIRIATDGTILYANAAFANMLGERLENILGASILDLLPPQTRADAQREIRDGAWGQGPFESALVAHGGVQIPVLVSSATLLEEGSPTLCVVVTQIAEQKRAQALLVAALRAKETLLREVHHRVKNNLQVICSLFAMQAERAPDPVSRQLLLEGTSRVRSIAMVHEMLYRSSDVAVLSIREYVSELVKTLQASYTGAPSNVATHLSVDDFRLDLDRSVTLGLLLNELLTNAFQHAFRDDRDGNLWVRLSLPREGLAELSVCDDGVGLPQGFDAARSPSMGLKLVHALAQQLGGKLEWHPLEPGTGFTVTFPIPTARVQPWEEAATRRPGHGDRGSVAAREQQGKTGA